MKGIRAAAGLLAIAFSLPGRLEAADYVIDFWDAARGLPGNSATAIAQTPEGYLWIGTYDGLARFDGIRFVRFDPSNTGALRHPRIERLFTDGAGTLWINTHDGSLTSWRNGVFTTEWTAQERVESAVWLAWSKPLEQVFVLQSGSVLRRIMEKGQWGPWQTIRPPGTAFTPIFCATRSGELWIRSEDERLFRITGGRAEEVPARAGLKGGVIRALAVDREDHVVVGTDAEIARWNGAAFEPMTPGIGREKVDVAFLYFATDGSFWAIADGRLRKGRDRRWILDAGPSRYLPDDILQALLPVEDKRGAIWFSHGGRGLLRIDADGTPTRFGAARGFASERVVSLFEDREANLWVSVDRGGVARVRERRFQVVNVTGEAASYAAISVSEARDGTVWIGSAGGGFARFRNGAVTSFSLPAPATRDFVVSILPDGDRLWMSADREDLWLFEKGVVGPAKTPVHGIKALLLDRDSRLWMGRRDGLARLTQGKVEHFGPADGMGITDVRALAEDREGQVWIGGGDGSIYRHRDGRFERIQVAAPGLAQPIWSLLAQADGVVWAGTYQGGLLRLENGRVTRYTTREGLLSDVVCQIVDDDQGHLWLGAREGILRVSKESLRAVAEGRLKVLSSSTYGRADDIPPLECSGFQPGAWRARDGRLWFATTRGAVSVSPAELRDNKVKPPVVIEEVWVDRVRHEASTNETVIVPAGGREVEFRFTGLSLSAPEAVRFRYRLIGLDPSWVDASDRRTAQYSYLPPGDYRFQVSAGNSDGVWNEEGSTLSLRVLPHIWETRWFQALLIFLSLALAAGGARHLSTRALRDNLRHLEQQRAIESDRARIAKDIHDDLGAGLTQISLLSELLRDDGPQEARAHVEQIGETAVELTRAMDEIVWAVNPSEDTLDSLWDYITHFAQEYLATAGIACRLEAPESIPARHLGAEVRHHFFLGVKEALNNVVKHASAQEVRLRLAVGEAQFEIEVQDDGRGRSAARSADRQRISSGKGLRNLDERMLSVGARFEISDVPQGGTRVLMTARLP